MSAFSGSSDDTLAFHIRANTDMLKRDLDGSLAYIKRFSDEAQRSLAKISSMTPATRSSFAPTIAMPQMLPMQAIAQARTAPGGLLPGGFGPRANQMYESPIGPPTAQAAAESEKLAANQEKVAVATEKSAGSTRNLFRALLIAKVAAEGLKVAADGIDLKKAFDVGDLAGIEKAKAALREAALAVPVAGGAGESIGRIINSSKQIGGDRGLRAVANVRDKIARYFGSMTDDEAAKAQADQERSDAELKKLQEQQRIRQAAQDRAVAVVEGVDRTKAREGKTPTEIAVLNAQEKLADFNKGVNPHRALSGDEQDARQKLAGVVVDAQAKDADAKIGKLRSGVAEVVAVAQSAWSAFTAKGAETMDRQIAGDAELREARLRTAGDVDQADRVALDERHRRRINAAAEQGDYEKQIAIDVAAEEDKQLEATIAKRREGERERDNATVLSIEGDIARQSLVRAVAVDARSALMSNLIGGTSSDENERYLRDVNKQQLDALLAIKAKVGGPATFG